MEVLNERTEFGGDASEDQVTCAPSEMTPDQSQKPVEDNNFLILFIDVEFAHLLPTDRVLTHPCCALSV